MNKKLSFVLGVSSILPIALAASSCNSNKNINQVQADLDNLEPNEIGKKMYPIEIKNRLKMMQLNAKSNEDIIGYINLFLTKPIDHNTYQYVSVEDQLKSVKFTLKITANKTLHTAILNNLTQLVEHDNEDKKNTEEKIKIGNITISTSIGSKAQSMSAIEFGKIYRQKHSEFNGDPVKLLDWLKQDKYFDIEGDYKSGEYIYHLSKHSHAHGENEFHAFFTAENAKTGMFDRLFDLDGKPGISFNKGWNTIAKIGNILIKKRVKISANYQNNTAQQFINEINSAIDSKAKLAIITKYTGQDFSSFTEDKANLTHHISVSDNTKQNLEQVVVNVALKATGQNQPIQSQSVIVEGFLTKSNEIDVPKNSNTKKDNDNKQGKIENSSTKSMSFDDNLEAIDKFKTKDEITQYIDADNDLNPEKIKDFIYDLELDSAEAGNLYSEEEVKFIKTLVNSSTIINGKFSVQNSKLDEVHELFKKASSIDDAKEKAKAYAKLAIESRIKLTSIALSGAIKKAQQQLEYARKDETKEKLNKLIQQAQIAKEQKYNLSSSLEIVKSINDLVKEVEESALL
ncbi:lipoprotein [Mycoplasmopsis californica]|uniref:Lipoprotein n=1 Tax=Mycoplasmopsis californica TaxID=2113 RepID=A0A059XRS9_9BACT|nr:hypothetical protein [Mycoplasmopsis californica]AIA29523.1 lipoprotein [Mycoplasmopsis californica]